MTLPYSPHDSGSTVYPKPLEVGITGGIGTGKSLVCRIFSLLNVPVYDADSRAKWLVANDPLLKEQIKNKFGNDIFSPQGELNRVLLASRVFSDAEQLTVLNSLVHPRVGDDYKRWVALQQGVPYVLKEAALLYESGSYATLHKVIVVTAPLELRLERIQARDPQRTLAEIHAIINKQMDEALKISRADYVIHNDGTQPLIRQILALHIDLLNLVL
jgi:dephospho-CoA kinase